MQRVCVCLACDMVRHFESEGPFSQVAMATITCMHTVLCQYYIFRVKPAWYTII